MAIKKSSPVSFSQFLAQICSQGSLAQDKLSVLDDIKNELKQEKAKKIKADLLAFHKRMDERVQALRTLRIQEAQVLVQIKTLQAEVEKYLTDNSEDVKL
jgi:hypothetical protein